MRIILYSVMCVLVLAPLSARADQKPALKKVFGKTPMVLLGSAVKKFLTFRVVSVDLYIADAYSSEDVLSDIPKRLEVNYHLNIPKDELDRATIKGIKKNYSQEQLAALMPYIDQINSYYPDVKSGDQIAITYIPGIGSEVRLNGQVKGIVPGHEFAKAFFSIWVGKVPVDQEAKLKLLGKKQNVKR